MRNNHVDVAQPTLVTATAAAGAAAVITIPAKDGEFWVIDWISASYAATPTAGLLTIQIDSVVVYQVDITASGPTHIDLGFPIYRETPGKSVVITLAAGGQAKNLNVRYR